jgi:hypothetical protein
MEWLQDLFGVGASVVLGGLGGGLMRLLPDFVQKAYAFFMAAKDRAHELAMRQLDREIAKDGGELSLRQIEANHNAADSLSRWQALIEGVKAQGQVVGVAWADAWNISIRPGLTTGFFLVWMASRIFPQSVVWGPEDTMMFVGLLNFWFVGQILEARRELAVAR